MADKRPLRSSDGHAPRCIRTYHRPQNAALITAGINTGVVSVTLDLVPEPTADPDTTDWDDVVEASIAHVDSGLALPRLGTEEWQYLPTEPSHRQTGTVSRARIRAWP